MLMNDDYQVFHLINSLAGTAGLFNPFMVFLAQYAEYFFFLGVIVYWFTRTAQNRRMVVQALVSACVALGVSGMLGHLFYRDRPFVTHTVFQLIKHAANASFPSDHATAAFVIATSIWLYRKKAGTVWLILAAGIGFSRIWDGVHYPIDVIAGAFIGIVSAVVIHALVMRWTIAQRGLHGTIGLYEKAEQLIWPRK
jgi:undecaprenyl-diphosphatase